MTEKAKKVMIAAGGTGGHIFTGVAVAEEFAEMLPGSRITFVGTSRGLEQRVIPSLGWQLVMIKAPKYKGMSGFRKLMALIKIPFSTLSALRVINSKKPDILVSIGGYASGPLSIAAWLFRVPIVLVEPNAIPGMANRLVGRFARLIFVAFDNASSYFNSAKVIKYGVPVRKVIREAKHELKDLQNTFTIFVFGGSQGAKRLNDSMKDAVRGLSDLKDRLKIIHQTGSAESVTEI
ncbi:MAG: UDP-N-acetylglucosamine--N-acetylmuramyl-(pentapeptide) pyrophosphoryl-undecaprenol N-acetylglucosamine transferase, partial [Deltaproteobacteria bacterium]|nr:UDP-N-acetylglucosamine--N-acetylmuramyl-(pentapeptide) pyrophosphoryl-undecaprenol N-acetylglucosamine transferase [Deltaproteobacteria bacterium]